ncbi:unnamed protein product [Vitrella brassicaformis CCMP3155]|uniref:Uncharacterized protein n=1 Tax=Vitrella brassicaformis (strain CCMP3155) TaxID=1169540 RepID=A0A0G4FVN8_VITBC|nr:unnamed protein product [Vitrella brassicaformis CCMP3155]|eukprot:CEM18625.1 unnamed protein product [Vitrella brassicaformis CCMP3155]
MCGQPLSDSDCDAEASDTCMRCRADPPVLDEPISLSDALSIWPEPSQSFLTVIEQRLWPGGRLDDRHKDHTASDVRPEHTAAAPQLGGEGMQSDGAPLMDSRRARVKVVLLAKCCPHPYNLLETLSMDADGPHVSDRMVDEMVHVGGSRDALLT